MLFYNGMGWIGDVIILFAHYGAAGEAGDEQEANEAGVQILWIGVD
jgi:hypothetical protein